MASVALGSRLFRIVHDSYIARHTYMVGHARTLEIFELSRRFEALLRAASLAAASAF